MTDTIEVIFAQTQAQMADHMAITERNQQALTREISNVNKTLVEGQIRQAVLEERLLSVVEDNQRRDTDISKMRHEISGVKQDIRVNSYVRTALPQIIIAILAAGTASGSAVWVFASKTLGP